MEKKPFSKSEVRPETNRVFLNLVNKYYEMGVFTPESARDNIDAFLQGIATVGVFDSGTIVKASKPPNF